MDLETIMNAELTWLNAVAWYVIALVVGVIGGAIGGIIIGGKDLGFGLASMLGMFFGPMAAAPGVLLAFVVLNFI